MHTRSVPRLAHVILCAASVIQLATSQQRYLSITVQPSHAVARQPFLVQPEIGVWEDSSFTIPDTANSPPPVITATGINATYFDGTPAEPASNGVATFTNLAFMRPGTYTIRFETGGGVGVESQPIVVREPLSSLTLQAPQLQVTAVNFLTPPPAAALANAGGEVLVDAFLPVIVSLNDLDATGAELACCNCSVPACALCAFPSQGVASFDSLVTAGSQVKEFSLPPDQEPPVKEVITTLATLSSSFEISSGPPVAVTFSVQPALGAIGEVGVRSPALLTPAPEIVVSDVFANPVLGPAAQGAGQVVGVPCRESSERWDGIGPRVCVCGNSTCLAAQLERVIRGEAQEGVRGNSTGVLEGGAASLDRLALEVARTDLRLVAYQVKPGVPLGSVWVLSARFVVSPGALDHIRLARDPADAPSCPRCPQYLVPAGYRLPAELELRDALGNLMTACESAQCFGVPNTRVRVELTQNGRAVNTTQALASEEGLVVAAVAGRVSLPSLRVVKAGQSYAMVFTAEALGDAGRTVSVQTKTFHVTNGQPTTMLLSQASNRSADSENFPAQPSLRMTDEFGNPVLSDCLVNSPSCRELLNATLCTYNTSRCEPEIQVGFRDALQLPRITGQTVLQARQGLVRFTDLGIQSDPAGQDKCLCNAQGDCPPCSADECFIAAPFPHYHLSFTSNQAGVSDVVQGMTLDRRAQRIAITLQPITLVAQEAFARAVRVTALDCGGRVVRFSSGSVSVAIDSSAGGGALSGTTVLGVERGAADFTDLSIDLSGAGYTLRFTYSGISFVPDTLSIAFDVVPPVTSLRILTTPRGVIPAGAPFPDQPSVELLDARQQVVTLSTMAVTVSIARNPGDQQPHDPGQARVLGEAVLRANQGRVVFSGLALNKATIGQGLPRTGYTLFYGFTGFSAESPPFEISPAEWAGLMVAPDGHASGAMAGLPFAVQPKLYCMDRFQNRVLEEQVPRLMEVSVAVHRAPPHARVSLLRHSCNAICVGSRPQVCSTSFCSNRTVFGDTGNATFTDLRLDIAWTSYQLIFRTSVGGFSAISQPFEVLNSLPSYPFLLDQVDTVANADMTLPVQPRVTVRDAWGNPVTVDSIPNRTVTVELIPPGGILPTQPPMPLAPGQRPNSVCRVADPVFEGTFVIPIDASGAGSFTNLAVRQVMEGYRLAFTVTASTGLLQLNSTAFDVIPGTTVGICNMSVAEGCSEQAVCRNDAVMACADQWGNVQPSCETTLRNEVVTPWIVPFGYKTGCPNRICVTLLDGPVGSAVTSTSQTLEGSGIATFTDILISRAGGGYRIKFSTYVVHTYLQEVIEWSYTTPTFIVRPPAPIITAVVFTPSMSQLRVLFNRATNMNFLQDEQLDRGCSSLLTDAFLFSLGADPFCTWQRQDLLLISVGYEATVVPETEFQLSNNSNVTFEGTYDGIRIHSAPATTIVGSVVGGVAIASVFPQLPVGALSIPNPVVRGPSTIYACDKMQADASFSTGNGARPWQEQQWGVDFGASYLYKGVLEGREEPRFLKKRIHFRSLVPGDRNLVTVTLQPNAHLLPLTNITITGLPGYRRGVQDCPFRLDDETLLNSCDPTQGLCRSVPLTGPSAHLFIPAVTGVPAAAWVTTEVKKELFHELHVSIRPDTFHLEKQELVFAFEMVNPTAVVANTPVEVSAAAFASSGGLFQFGLETMEMNCERVCSPEPAFFQVALHPLSVAAASILESSSVLSARNTLSVHFTPRETVPPASVVAVANLFGSLTPNGTLCVGGDNKTSFQCLQCGGSATAIASSSWDQTSGIVTLTVREGFSLPAGQPVSLEFQLFNPAQQEQPATPPPSTAALNLTTTPAPGPGSGGGPATPSNCDTPEADPVACRFPNIRILSRGGLSEMEGPPFYFGNRVLRAETAPALTFAAVREAHAWLGLQNFITLSFSANLFLPTGSRIHFHGLFEASNPNISLPALDLFCGDALCMCFAADGEKGKAARTADGSVHIEVASGCSLPPDTVYSVALEVENPTEPSTARSLSVDVDYAGCEECFESCGCNKTSAPAIMLDAVPMQGSVWGAGASIALEPVFLAENNSIPDQLNTLSLTLRCNSAMLPGSKITIEGILGTGFRSNMELPIHTHDGDVHELIRGSVGSFDLKNGSLTLELSQILLPSEDLAIAFAILNGASPEANGTLTVQAVAIVPSCQFHPNAPLICPRVQAVPPASPETAAALGDAGNESTAVAGARLETWTQADVLRNGTRYRPAPASLRLSRVTLPGRVFVLADAPMALLAEIVESSVDFSALNIISVRVVTNFRLNGSSTVEITGLSNTPVTSTRALVHVPSYNALLPNCSCSQFEGFPCDTCDNALAFANDVGFRVFQPDIDEEHESAFGSVATGVGATESAWDQQQPGCTTDCGRLVLQLLPHKQWPAGRELQFSFVLINPSSPIDAAQPQIRIRSGETASARQPMQGAVLGPYTAASFPEAWIWQDKGVQGAFTTLHVRLQVSSPIASNGEPGALLTISGLEGFDSPAATIPLYGVDAYTVSKSALAVWDATQHRLILSGGTFTGGCTAPTSGPRSRLCSGRGRELTSQVLDFAFVLKAAQTGSELPDVTVSLQSKTASIAATVMGGNASLPRASSPQILRFETRESSQWAGDRNTLSFAFALNVDLRHWSPAGPSSTVTVLGLSGSQTAGNGSAPLAGKQAALFGHTAAWNRTSGSLVLTVAPGAVLPAGQTAEVQVELVNAASAQLSSRPSLSATVPLQPLLPPPSFAAAPGALEAEPLLVGPVTASSPPVFGAPRTPVLSQRRIRELTSVSGAVNVLSLSLASPVGFAPGSRIVLCGLTSPSPSRSVSIFDQEPSATVAELAEWAADLQQLVATLAAPLLPGEPLHFSFRLKNPTPSTANASQPAGTAALCGGGAAEGVRVSVEGGGADQFLRIEPAVMEGEVLKGGAEVQWFVKTVRESSPVAGALSRLTFHVQPSATLHAGSRVVLRGLTGTSGGSCQVCTGSRDGVPGLGCSAFCSQCSEGFAGAPACLAVFEQDMVPHPLFESRIAGWDPVAGQATLVVAEGQVLAADATTALVMVVRNPSEAQARRECWPFANDPSLCISISAENLQICDPSGTDSESACPAENPPRPADLTVATRVAARPTELVDRCAVCVRQEDIAAVDDALRQYPNLLLQDFEVHPPTREGLPTFIEGGVSEGNYTIGLRLKNWLGNERVGKYMFLKSLGEDGPLGTEDIKPLLYIDGDDTLQIQSNEEIRLQASGTPSMCQLGARQEFLRYEWDFECIAGPCGQPRPLSQFTSTVETQFLVIQSGRLASGATYRFTCTATQPSLEIDMSTSVVVSIRLSPLIPVISGVSNNGTVSVEADTEIDAALSIDPDAAATGLSSADFVYRWSCFELVPDPASASALNGQEACEGHAYGQTACQSLGCCEFEGATGTCLSAVGAEPCSYSRMKLVPCPGDMLQPGGTRLVVDSARYQLGVQYRIAVNISRPLDALSPSLQAVPGVADHVSTFVDFVAVPGAQPTVSVSVCDPLAIGEESGCRSPTQRINHNQPFALRAQGRPVSAQGSIVSYEWEVLSVTDPDLLEPQNLLTGATQPDLFIRAGVMIPGHQVRFRITVKDDSNRTGLAEFLALVNVPPLGGALLVSPSEGRSLVEDFTLVGEGWATDTDSLPLSYTFYFLDHGGTGIESYINSGPEQTIIGPLPPGDPAMEFALDIGLNVSDIYGSTSTRMERVRVLPASDDASVVIDTINDELQNTIGRVILDGDTAKSQALLGMLALSMNAIQDECSTQSILNATLACENVILERQAIRFTLLVNMQAANASQPPSPGSIQAQAAVIKIISSKVFETNTAMHIELVNFLEQAMGSAVQYRVNGSALATVHAETINNVLTATLDPTIARRRSVPSGEDVADPSAARSLSVESKGEEGSSSAGRRAAVVDAAVQEVRRKALNLVASSSSLSLKQAVDGQGPVILATESFTVNSSRISVAAFAGVLLLLEGSNASASLPADLFAQIDSELDPPASAELMLALTVQNPLPATLGPVMTVHARSYGSSQPLPLRFPLEDPIRLQIPVDEYFPPTDVGGGALVLPNGEAFDLQQWRWNDVGMRTGSIEEFWVSAVSSNLSHFSVVKANTGCDRVPNSPLRFDACGECGGRNETCSGCDGAPNTGRDRFCSGHGQCGQGAGGVGGCSCRINWFDSSCATYCSIGGSCSGHGLCHAQHGLPCKCDEGYSSTEDAATTGVFCSIGPPVPVPADQIYKEPRFKWWELLLLIALPALFVLGIVAWQLHRVRTQRQISHKLRLQAIAVVEHTDKMEAENWNKEHLQFMPAQPDQTGWAEVEPPSDEAEMPPASTDGVHLELQDQSAAAAPVGLAAALNSQILPDGDLQKLRDRQILNMQKRPESMRHHISSAKVKQNRYLESGPGEPLPDDSVDLVPAGYAEDANPATNGHQEGVGEVRHDARNGSANGRSNGARSADLVFPAIDNEVAL